MCEEDWVELKVKICLQGQSQKKSMEKTKEIKQNLRYS